MLHFKGVIRIASLHAVVHIEDKPQHVWIQIRTLKDTGTFTLQYTNTRARAHAHTQSAEHCSGNSASFAELHWALGAPQKPPLLIMNMHSFEAFVSAALLLSYLSRNSPHPHLPSKYRSAAVALCISNSLHEPSRPEKRLVLREGSAPLPGRRGAVMTVPAGEIHCRAYEICIRSLQYRMTVVNLGLPAIKVQLSVKL